MPFTRHTDADTALLGIYLTVRQEEDGDDTPDVAFDPSGLTTHGIQDFRPFCLQSTEEFGAGCYGSSGSRVRRGRVMIASAGTTLASRKELHLTPMKMVCTLGGMGTIQSLIDNGVDIGPLRNGLPVKITEELTEALKRDGFIPVTRKSGKNKVFAGCVPVDAKAAHVVKALAMWDAMCEQFQGYLGSDPVTGRERTKTEVCEHFVGIAVKAAAKRAKSSAKRKENAAAKADEAKAELAAAVEDTPSVEYSGEVTAEESQQAADDWAREAREIRDAELQEEPTPGFTNLVVRLSDEVAEYAKSNGVDINDPVALGEFFEALAVVFRDEPEQDEQVTRAS